MSGLLGLLELALLAAILYILLQQRGWPPRNKAGRRIIVDSCGLIDGRIVDLYRSGFVAGTIIVPEFVVRELQTLADGKDAHKRERARLGLDVLHTLRDTAGGAFELSAEDPKEFAKTDDKLVVLAATRKADIYTIDTGLAKVAAIRDVRVLNVNELALSLRPAILPGEQFQILLQQKGNGPNQAVGHTDDGTMVVVDNAARYIGRSVTVVCDRMHQTVAGKMIFASLQISKALVPAAKTAEPAGKLGIRLRRLM